MWLPDWRSNVSLFFSHEMLPITLHISTILIGLMISAVFLGLLPAGISAQDSTKVRREQVQSLIDDFHLGRISRFVEGFGVERLDDREMALRKRFLGERLSVGFHKSFPIDRKEESWEADYRLKEYLLLRGELRHQGTSEQGTVDLLFHHEY
jgi:hypothetical protein